MFWRNRGCPGAKPWASKAEAFAVVDCHPDLLNPAPPPVVPQQPPLPVEDGVRLVHGVRIPSVLPGSDDRVGRVSFPVGDTILRPGQADLGTVPVREPDVKHDMPVTLTHDLAG